MAQTSSPQHKTLKVVNICRKAFICTWAALFLALAVLLIYAEQAMPDVVFGITVSLAIASVLLFAVHFISFIIIGVGWLNVLTASEAACYIIAAVLYMAICILCCWLPGSFYW